MDETTSKRLKRVTRKATNVWLVGSQCDTLPHNGKLPTLRDTFKVFFKKLRDGNGKCSAQDAARQTIGELSEFWGKAAIPTQAPKDATEKLVKLYKKWRRLEKDAKLSSKNILQERQTFERTLDRTFDIGHKKARQLIEIEEDWLFYQSMITDRKGYISGIDTKWCLKQESLKRQQENLKKREAAREIARARSDREVSSLQAAVELESGTTGTSTTEESEEEFNPKNAKRLKINVLNSTLVTSTMDRTKTSCSAGSMLVKAIASATVQALGKDTEEVNIVASRARVRSVRESNRETAARQIKEEFKNDGPVVVHWDGKLLPSITGEKQAERLPVIVTGQDMEQLLGVPELDSGSGLNIACAVVDLLKAWNLVHLVVGMGFDTTATNSGRINGACTLIQQTLGKELLDLACRHHILELVVGAVFSYLFGDSSDPEVPFIAVLKEKWSTLNKANYRSAASVRGVLKQIPNSDEVLKFALEQLKEYQIREDYGEFLELAVVFLGGVVPFKHPYVFRKLGATSKARWMAKCIYALKIWMFGKQLRLSTEQETQLLKLCRFVVSIYLKHWFLARVATQAPANDLEMLKAMARSKEPHVQAGFQKFSNHLWYLSEKCVCLSLFDTSVSLHDKKSLVQAILFKDGSQETSPRATVTTAKALQATDLSHFASRTSLRFFEITGIPTSFLHVDPEDWPCNPDYLKGEKIAKHLQVVNDSAERGVQIIKRFLKTDRKVTQNETQRQYLMLVVKDHQKMFNKYGEEK